MPRLKQRDLLLNVLAQLGLDVSEDKVEDILSSLRARQPSVSLSFAEYFANMAKYSEQYYVDIAPNLPLEIVRNIYASIPEDDFSKVFRLVRRRERKDK